MKKHNTRMENVLDWILLWTGIVSTFLGTIGTILIAFSLLTTDKILAAVFTFVSFYMLFFGIFLLIYHKKIIVKPKFRRYY
jgi:sensor histidine kinase YesM